MNTSRGPEAWKTRKLTDLTLFHALRESVNESPDGIAVRDEMTELTYREFWDEGTALAGGLSAIGVAEGDHVLVMLDNSADYALTVIALDFLGAVTVPVNTMHKGNILRHVVTDSQATKAVVDSRYAGIMAAAGQEVLTALVVRGQVDRSTDLRSLPATPLTTAALGSPVIPRERNVWDPLLIGYTSGTTGSSKGVLLTNGQCMTISDPYELQRVFDPDPVFYVVCPMFHLTGMAGGLFASVAAGGTMHIAPRFSAGSFVEDATRAGATATTLVGTMADFILRQPPKLSDVECSLKNVVMIPLHPRTEEFKKRFGVEVRTNFGSTESNAILVGGEEETVARGSCGRAREHYEVKIVDDHDIEVPDGEIGEVVARCGHPWLMGGAYLGNTEATAASWRNGWFHFGDMLKRDKDGYFYFVDRKKDAIRRRGENISSIEVEREVLAHEDVVECAAVAVEDEHMEQEVKVFVVQRAGAELTEADLIHFLIDRMPRYSVPRYVQFIDELPRTATAKVRKHDLRGLSNEGVWDREAAGIDIPR